MTRDRYLDDLGEQTADRTERHQPAGPAIPEKERHYYGDAEQVLDQAAGHIGQGHPVGERPPGHLLDCALDGEIEPRSGHPADHQDREDHEQQQRDQSHRSQPATS